MGVQILLKQLKVDGNSYFICFKPKFQYSNSKDYMEKGQKLESLTISIIAQSLRQHKSFEISSYLLH